MKHDNAFIPESVEETIDQLAYAPHQEPLSPDSQLVQGLQQHYQAQQSATQRMWARLEHYVDTHEVAFEAEYAEEIQADEQQTNPLTMAGTRTRRIQAMKVEKNSQAHPVRRKIVSRLALLAALLCTFLIVGSLLIVFQAARSGHNSQLGTKQAASQTLYVSKATSVEKLDPKTHKVAWSTSLPNHPRQKVLAINESTPRVIGETLYIMRADSLFALNTSDGHILWQKPDVGLPFVDDGVLYTYALPDASAFTGKPVSASLIGSTLFALNPANGKVEATYNAPVGGWNSPTVANGILYYGTGGTHPGIVATKLADQQTLWQQTLAQEQSFIKIQVQNRIVYVQVANMNASGTDGRIVAFDANKGNQLWSMPALNTYVRAVTITNSAIYVALPGMLSAYDAHTGQMLWQKPFNTANILADANTLYINYVTANQEGATALAALNAANGTIIWQKNMPWLETNSPLGIQNGVIYTDTDNGSQGEIDALNASDGSSSWHMPLNGDATTWQAIFG